MSFNRYARRTDNAQASIVSGLECMGCSVVSIGRPVDLLVRYPSWPANRWMLLEIKTEKGKHPRIRLRSDQERQQEFCRAHRVPYVSTLKEAMEAMGIA